MYARELLEKIVAEEDLKILEAVWSEELTVDEKIEYILKIEKGRGK
ncbi:MAG: hypothetical protein QXW80_03975 [Candidatus Micrarchaeia archaeon]